MEVRLQALLLRRTMLTKQHVKWYRRWKRIDDLENLAVDYWPALVDTIPHLFETIQTEAEFLMSRELTPGKGRCTEEGTYREGTRFLHIIGIAPEIAEAFVELLEHEISRHSIAVDQAIGKIQAHIKIS